MWLVDGLGLARKGRLLPLYRALLWQVSFVVCIRHTFNWEKRTKEYFRIIDRKMGWQTSIPGCRLSACIALFPEKFQIAHSWGAYSMHSKSVLSLCSGRQMIRWTTESEVGAVVLLMTCWHRIRQVEIKLVTGSSIGHNQPWAYSRWPSLMKRCICHDNWRFQSRYLILDWQLILSSYFEILRCHYKGVSWHPTKFHTQNNFLPKIQ